jgi:signal transduction histidine kinase/CheY-like chemotaxis protein
LKGLPFAYVIRNRALSARAYLVALVISILLPVLFFTGLLAWQIAEGQRARYQDEALNAARRLSVFIDRELTAMRSALQVLATSDSLIAPDLPRFYAQALQVSQTLDESIVLKNVDGRQLINTFVPLGESLPTGLTEADEAAISTGRTQVSNLFTGAVTKRPVLAIAIPIVRDGEVSAVLSMGLRPERLSEMLIAQGMPEAWLVAVVDGNGRIAARTRDFARFIGQTATRDLLEGTRSREGAWLGTTADGVRVLGAYARPVLADWRVAVGVPVALLERPLRNVMLWLGLIGLGSLALSGAIAAASGGRIARGLQQLRVAAAALGRSEAVTIPPTPIREVNEIGAAMSDAAQALHERDAARQAAEDALRSFTEKLEHEVADRTRELRASNERLVAESEQREAAEAQLRQVQKMEAVGQLTGGIAHDFNNLLAIIGGSLQMLRRRLDKGEMGALPRYLDAADQATQRAATLTSRLLAFARQQPLAPVPFNLNKLIAGMSELLSRTLGETIAIETVQASGLWLTLADANQLEHALLNLAVNARDAMPEGGRLTIETANCDFDERYVAQNPGTSAGQYVLLAVTDTGTGMASEVVERAFDPFFTTKEAARGTGLGLSQVYGFVRQSGGHVKIYSEVGQGTTVKIYLPRYVGEGAPALGLRDAEDALPARGGGEVVLVVEDEDSVRALTVESLEELGYRVLAAEGAETALRLLDANPDVALLFTDVVMPGLNGRRLADEALRRRPALKVLFTTGYTRNAVVHNGILDHGVHLITKPFHLHQIGSKLREILA